MDKNFKPVPVAADRLHVPNDKTWHGAIWWFFIDVQLYCESQKMLERSKDKPARVLPRGDSSYLTELANSAFTNKQGQILYNPSDRQLDKIFDGALYGYR